MLRRRCESQVLLDGIEQDRRDTAEAGREKQDAMARDKRLYVWGRDPEITHVIVTVLEDEGYIASSTVKPLEIVSPPEVVQALQQHRPDLLLLALGRDEAAAFAVLDALRGDAITEHVPIVALSADAPLVEKALSSYNVRDALALPFEIDTLLQKVRYVLDEPTIHATMPVVTEDTADNGAVARARRILQERSREALLRWVLRLRQQEPWAERDDLRLADVLDSMPIAVEAAEAALHYGDAERFFAEQPVALERVRQHAFTRRVQGIPLAAVVREYTLLRQEHWQLFRRSLPEQMRTADLLHIEEVVNGTLDRIIEEAITAYTA